MPIILEDAPAAAVATTTDTLRLVQFTAPHYEAQRPTLLADLTTATRKIAEGGSPQLAPGERELGNIVLDVPWAGEVTTLDRHRNSRLTFVLRTLAADPIADTDSIVAQLVNAPARSAIEWRRDGTGYPTYFPLRGDVDWTPTYSMRERRQGAGMLVQVGCEVAPYVHRGSMDIHDAYVENSLADYTFHAGQASTEWAANELRFLTTGEHHFVHSLRGHTFSDGQVTLAWIAGADYANSIGVILRSTDANNHILLEYTPGTPNGVLRLWRKTAGVYVAITSNASAPAQTAGQMYWIRLRAEGNLIHGEMFTGAPTPMTVPTLTTTPWTVTGADLAAHGEGVSGRSGIRWTVTGSPSGYAVKSLKVEPFTYRNRALPEGAAIALKGTIPGDLPALADIEVTPSGGAAAPIFGLASWWKQTTGSMFGIRAGGSTWTVDPTGVKPDHDGLIDLDVWATISSVGTRVLSAYPAAGAAYGATRYGEFGAGGVAVAFTGSRLVRLGRIAVPAYGSSTLAASGNPVDSLLILPAHGLAHSPIGVANDAAYPKFVRSTAEATRVMHSDGSGSLGPPSGVMAEHGMGRRVEFPAGSVDLLVRLASVVPGDPTAGSTSEQASHSATVRAKILPRYLLA